MPVSNINEDDKLLFEAISKGDEVAFKALFEKYKIKTLAIAFKWTKSVYAAEEITQEVFISIWISRAKLPMVIRRDAYLNTVIYNKIKRHLKKEANKTAILNLPEWKSKEVGNEVEELIFANDNQRFINNFIAQLSPQKRLIYRLSREEGKNYHEIAEMLKLSPNTVKSHLVKALKFLRNRLQNNC